MFDRDGLQLLAREIARSLAEELQPLVESKTVVIRVVIEPELTIVSYSRERVAEMFETSVSTVDRWRKQGLETFTVGSTVRILRSAMLRFVEEGGAGSERER
jgi:hypothetical protein